MLDRNRILFGVGVVLCLGLMLLGTLLSPLPAGRAAVPVAQPTGATIANFLPIVHRGGQQGTSCAQSGLGAVLFSEPTSGESTGPYLVSLAQAGYTGLAGTPTYGEGSTYFPQLPGWGLVQICNTHDCLRTRGERGAVENLAFDYLSYGPERHDGVPDEEKYNLPWASQVARDIADQYNKKLILSFSTKQLHQEAEERGYDWNDPSEVVDMLAPYADVWLIQAADEYWRLDDGTVRPVLSQRVYPPGPEFRAELERWIGWLRAANPDVEIWIQLALQRIGVPGETEPDADLVLEYRAWIADLVDGIYLMPIYGSVEQFPVANQEMVKVFQRACDAPAVTLPPEAVPAATPVPSAPAEQALPVQREAPAAVEAITLIQEGWTDDVEIPCTPNGTCLTILPGYYYRIYENTAFPCGAGGNHEFIVVDHGPDSTAPRNLFAKFLGGGVGFWYEDGGGNLVYYPQENAAGILTSSNNRNMFFRTSVSAEFANGVTKKFRENSGFRLLVPSYCSHDLYQGSGEYNALDGFNRWGYSAAMAAVDYVQQNYSTQQIIAYGGSAGAAGSFYVGKDQDHVAGIIMDSQAVDLAAIRDACYDGYNVFGASYPCFCPEGGDTCMELLAPRIGFSLDAEEPWRFVQQGLDTPIYFVWNERDASLYAHLQFDNLHAAIEQYNPGGQSVANMVCITNPASPPGPTCNLHVPSGYDLDDTAALVNEIYTWALSLIGGPADQIIYLPLVAKP